MSPTRRLAAAGILIPEGLQANGADIRGGTWFETGAEMLNGGTLNYVSAAKWSRHMQSWDLPALDRAPPGSTCSIQSDWQALTRVAV